jgi:hypothetical protein
MGNTTSTYLNNVVLDEIHKSNYSNLVNKSNETGLYLIRIYMAEESKYMFKFGKTQGDLVKRLEQITQEFQDCDSEVLLVSYAKTNNVHAEKEMHDELRKKYKNGGIKNRMQKKSYEVYDISCDFYNDFFNLLDQQTNGVYFRSHRYKILPDIYGMDSAEFYETPTEIIDQFDEDDLDIISGEPSYKRFCFLGIHKRVDYQQKFWSIVKYSITDNTDDMMDWEESY